MSKFVTSVLVIFIVLFSTGCAMKDELTLAETDTTEITSTSTVETVDSTSVESTDETEADSVLEIDAPIDVQSWAQYEIDNLIRMLSVDGFYINANGSDSLTKVEIQDNKITKLYLMRKLGFSNDTTIDLYRIEFKLLPRNLTVQNLFTLDSGGWITSDENFTYGDANGYEQKNGALYLLIHDDKGQLTSMGIRRAEMLTDKWCEDLLAYYNYPPGVNFALSNEEIQAIYDYWQFDVAWSFKMPCNNGYGDVWYVGLGDAHEWGIGVPYENVGSKSMPADGIAGILFTSVRDFYYDGLVVTSLDGFYGDDPNGPGFSVNQYITTTQADCETARGVHVGDTVETLKMLYPEVINNDEQTVDFNPELLTPEYDNSWVYAPENSNRSILFLVKDGVIVQIDIADGLDGQYTSPRGTLKYK